MSGKPEWRVCQICARNDYDELHPELKKDEAWTHLPPIAALGGRTPWVMTACWDDLTKDLHSYIAEREAEIAELKGEGKR